MHEAWLIDDIWRLLASYLNDKDLAVLAQTCKALYPLASAEKWKTITSFSGLLACLPQRHQCDKLQAKDLERMDFYSAMVQAIELGSKDDPHPLCVPSRYDAALEKQKREVTLRYGEMLDSVERKKRNEERKRMKMEKKKARARRRGTVPQVIDEDRKTEESMDLSELKTTIDEDDPDAPGRKMWADLWGEIAELRPQSLFLPNVRRITIYRATCDCLVPLVGISGSRLEKLYVRFIHGEKSEHLTGNFLYRLQDVSKLEYLFVRDSMDLIPRKVIAHAPLRQLRLDPRISRDCWDDYSFKSKPVLVGILEKESIEHLTIGLSREWHTPDIEALEHKCLPRLKTLWLNLISFLPEPCDPNCRNIASTPAGWTCKTNEWRTPSLNGPFVPDCGRRPPSTFFEKLDKPSLQLLNIKFSYRATDAQYLSVCAAAKQNLRLDNLSELALTGGGWFPYYHEFAPTSAKTIIHPTTLRKGLQMLLPLPQLKTLRLSAAPNFLSKLDLDLYRKIAAGIPKLKSLILGHRELPVRSSSQGEDDDTVPLYHLAAFCCQFRELEDVQGGAIDGLRFEPNPNIEWQCVSVKKLRIHDWGWGRRTQLQLSGERVRMERAILAYFPESDLAAVRWDQESYREFFRD